MIDKTISKAVTVGNSGVTGGSVLEGVAVAVAVAWVLGVGSGDADDNEVGKEDCVGITLGLITGVGVGEGEGDWDGKGIADKLAKESVP
jgi:hypothetical protein